MDEKRKSKIDRYEPSFITIYNKDREIVLQQPSLVAIETEMKIIYFIGKDAVNPTGDMASSLMIGSPFRKGVVADFDVAASLMQIFLRYLKYNSFIRPKIAVCSPVDMTDVEYKALNECMFKAGAKKVLIFEDSFSSVCHEIPAMYNVVIEILPE